MIQIQIPVNPESCTRPRFNGRTGRAYHTSKYRQYREAVEAILRERWTDPPIDYPVEVTIICYVRRPKTTKLDFPKPDVDNYAKGILDALQGPKDDRIVLQDDSLVKRCDAEKCWAPDGDPGRIHVLIEPIQQ